ncbi:MAG: hypothetical protein ACLRZ9_12215 [Eubacterium sp.]
MKIVNNTKIVIDIICVLICAVILIGCGKDTSELEVYGGDIIKNNTMIASENYWAYEVPIILNSKIKDFDIKEYKISGKGSYDIKFKELTGGEEYNGWYYYFANLEVSVDNDVRADFSVESIDMTINGENIKYVIPDLHFSNAAASLGAGYDTEKRNFVYNTENTFLYQYIPKETTQTIGLDIQNDCTITEFKILDFVVLENLVIKVNDKETNLENGICVHKGDNVEFNYTLNYKEGVSETNLLKTTSYITYIDENDKKCAFIDEQGIMIINYQNDKFIKDYIDSKFGGK